MSGSPANATAAPAAVGARPAWPWALGAAGLAVPLALAGAATSPWTVTLVLVAAALVAAAFVRLEYAVVGLVVTFSLDTYGRIVPDLPVTFFQVLLVACLISWGVRIARDPAARPVLSPMHAGYAMLLFAAAWSLPASLDRGATAVSIGRLVFLVAFAVMAESVMRERRVQSAVLAVLVVTGAATGALAVAQATIPGFDFGAVRMVDQVGFYLRRVGALFYDPNYCAAFLSVTFAVAGALAVRARRVLPGIAWCAGAALSAAGVLATLSRSGLAGLAFAAVAIVVTAPRGRRVRLAVASALVAATLLVAAPAGVARRVSMALSSEQDKSSATRVAMFASAVDIAAERWVFGTGLSAFDERYPAYRRPEADPDILKPHELPVALVSEMGVAGLLAEIALAAGLVTAMWRRRRHSGWTAGEAAAAAGLASLLVQSFFQYHLYFEPLWLMCALAVASTRIAAEQSEEVLTR